MSRYFSAQQLLSPPRLVPSRKSEPPPAQLPVELPPNDVPLVVREVRGLLEEEGQLLALLNPQEHAEDIQFIKAHYANRRRWAIAPQCDCEECTTENEVEDYDYA